MSKTQHPVLIEKKTGVLLINLGTPDNCNYFSVRRYLKEFLSDPRIIEINPFLWKIILNVFILTFRPYSTAKKYQQIWMKDTGESPLRHYTKSKAAKLQVKMKQNTIVDYAMRYGNPSIKNKIHLLIDKGCRKIIFVPLYPQYSATTTASTADEIYRVMQQIRWQPEIKIVHQYCDNEIYIKSLVNSVEKTINNLDWQPDAILSSYHGIPKEYFNRGDPYYCFCHKTNRLFNDELTNRGINIKNHLCFQSRFGPKEWLQPYAKDKILELLEQGTKNLLVIAPGFSSDCVETLEEIDIEYKNFFLTKGGENFLLIPCLNDSNNAISIIYDLVKHNTALL